jgi:hypothetical protein
MMALTMTSPPEPTAPADSQRRAIVVLGMHRSGTSAVAGCLQRLGVDFGPRLMPPTPDNPRGFYEHIDIVNLHDRLLLAAGSSWDDTDPRPPEWLAETATARFREDLREILRRDFASSALWGLKDPRLCRLLPWWQPLWAELHTRPLFVIVLRDPREVTASLARRDGFSPGKAYLLWLQHILAAERATRQAERVFLDFGGFLADWRQGLAPVGALLGKPWPVPPESEALAEERFVDGALSQANPSSVEGKLPLWVEETDAALRRERKTGAALFAVLDRVAAQAEAAQALYGGAREQTNDLTRQLTALREQARWYEAEWQKARQRWRASRVELEKRDKQASEHHSRILKLEHTISYMRLDDSSNVREAAGWWGRFWSAFRSR